MLKDIVLKNRSYRRFYEEYRVSRDVLIELIDLARFSASAANLQPLKYCVSYDPEKNMAIYSCLKWAGYLTDWDGPKEGERPSAYIVILGDTAITGNFGCDHGIAGQSIMLGASEKGLGGCIIGSVDRLKLKSILKIDDKYEILLVIALGKPKEKVVLDQVGDDGAIRYWRDAEDAHHVPKRQLNDIVLQE